MPTKSVSIVCPVLDEKVTVMDFCGEPYCPACLRVLTVKLKHGGKI